MREILKSQFFAIFLTSMYVHIAFVRIVTVDGPDLVFALHLAALAMAATFGFVASVKQESMSTLYVAGMFSLAAFAIASSAKMTIHVLFSLFFFFLLIVNTNKNWKEKGWGALQSAFKGMILVGATEIMVAVYTRDMPIENLAFVMANLAIGCIFGRNAVTSILSIERMTRVLAAKRSVRLSRAFGESVLMPLFFTGIAVLASGKAVPGVDDLVRSAFDLLGASPGTAVSLIGPISCSVLMWPVLALLHLGYRYAFVRHPLYYPTDATLGGPAGITRRSPFAGGVTAIVEYAPLALGLGVLFAFLLAEPMPAAGSNANSIHAITMLASLVIFSTIWFFALMLPSYVKDRMGHVYSMGVRRHMWHMIMTSFRERSLTSFLLIGSVIPAVVICGSELLGSVEHGDRFVQDAMSLKGIFVFLVWPQCLARIGIMFSSEFEEVSRTTYERIVKARIAKAADHVILANFSEDSVFAVEATEDLVRAIMAERGRTESAPGLSGFMRWLRRSPLERSRTAVFRGVIPSLSDAWRLLHSPDSQIRPASMRFVAGMLIVSSTQRGFIRLFEIARGVEAGVMIINTARLVKSGQIATIGDFEFDDASPWVVCPAIFGDITDPRIQEHCRIHYARLVVGLPDDAERLDRLVQQLSSSRFYSRAEKGGSAKEVSIRKPDVLIFHDDAIERRGVRVEATLNRLTFLSSANRGASVFSRRLASFIARSLEDRHLALNADERDPAVLIFSNSPHVKGMLESLWCAVDRLFSGEIASYIRENVILVSDPELLHAMGADVQEGAGNEDRARRSTIRIPIGVESPDYSSLLNTGHYPLSAQAGFTTEGLREALDLRPRVVAIYEPEDAARARDRINAIMFCYQTRYSTGMPGTPQPVPRFVVSVDSKTNPAVRESLLFLASGLEGHGVGRSASGAVDLSFEARETLAAAYGAITDVRETQSSVERSETKS